MDPDATGTGKTRPKNTESRADSVERIKKEPSSVSNSGGIKVDTSSGTSSDKSNRQEQWNEAKKESNNPAIDGNYNSSDNNNEENNDSDVKNITTFGPNDHFDPISPTSGSSFPGPLDVSSQGYLSSEMNRMTTDGKLMEAISRPLTVIVEITFDV